MDRYQGIYRVQAKLTDNSDYSYFKHTKAALNASESAKKQDESSVNLGDIVYNANAEKETAKQPLFIAREDCYVPYENIQSAKGNGFASYEDDIVDGEDCFIIDSKREKMLTKLDGDADSQDSVAVYKSKKNRKNSFFMGLFIRTIIAAALFLSILAIGRVNHPIFEKISSGIKNAIAYDFDTNKDKNLGEVRVVDLIIEAIEESKEAQEGG